MASGRHSWVAYTLELLSNFDMTSIALPRIQSSVRNSSWESGNASKSITSEPGYRSWINCWPRSLAFLFRESPQLSMPLIRTILHTSTQHFKILIIVWTTHSAFGAIVPKLQPADEDLEKSRVVVWLNSWQRSYRCATTMTVCTASLISKAIKAVSSKPKEKNTDNSIKSVEWFSSGRLTTALS